MKKYKSIQSVLVAVGLMFTAGSCTDLSETVYTDLVTENFYSTKGEVLSAVARPYTHARAWAAPTGQNGYWRLNEYTADQIAWPTKGRHGYDGGAWIRQHYHTWEIKDNSVWNAWRLMFWGMGLCTDVIDNLSQRDARDMGISEEEKTAYVAEMKGFRAYHYLKLMDLYGNIPVVTKVGTPVNPPTVKRPEVFKFIESELLECVNELPVLSQENIGRIARAGGYCMLAEMYLNSEVWTGIPRWDDCIAACDYILSGKAGSQTGNLDLDRDLTSPFNNANTTNSKENLLVFAYDYTSAPNYCAWSGDFYHFAQRYIYGGDKNGNNGAVVIPSAFDMFDDKDLRKSQWMLIGPQYYYDDPTKPVKGTEEYRDKPLVFVKYIYRASEGKTEAESSMYNGEENSGARFNKYNPGISADRSTYWNNDWVLYRLTEIKYFKAEALMRKNGGVATQEAVDLINDCRQRAFKAEDWSTFKYTTATLTLDELIKERGREFIFEGKRRPDLIRFGKFVSTDWWDHKASNDVNKNIFPIPYTALTANSILEQNPGYNRE